MGFWTAFCLKFFLSTNIIIKGRENILNNEADKLEDLQTKAVLKAGLTGVALDNDMGGNLLYNVEISQLAMSKYAAGVLAGSVSLDYANGYYQTLTTSASITPITTNPGTISLGSVKGGTSSFKVRVLFPQGYTIADHGISLLQLNATKTDVDWTKAPLAFKQLDASGEATLLDNGNYMPHYEQKQYVQFYGMSSKAANDKHFGGLQEYRSSEGRDVMVPYRGPVETTVNDILGGIRSTCTYVGALKLKQLSKCATFVMCPDTHNRVYENN